MLNTNKSNEINKKKKKKFIILPIQDVQTKTQRQQ